jgi:hypothetical protein
MKKRHVAIFAIYSTILGPLAALGDSAMYQNITPQQVSSVEDICLKTMQLLPAGPEFGGCVSSLAQSLSDKVGRDMIVASYTGCARAGLSSGTPAFADCVLDRRRSSVTGIVHGDASTGWQPRPDAGFRWADSNAGDSWSSHAFVSNRVHNRRMEGSCAQLGIVPASSAFRDCVSNLDTTMFNIDHPPG